MTHRAAFYSFDIIGEMTRSHVVISGTGRAGTTFLVQLLTNLGLDTGYRPDEIALSPLARAGLEFDIRAPTAPYIVKSPNICDWAEEALASAVRLEHAIIPVRQFEAAASSRAHVQETTTGSRDGKTVWGGLWATDKADDQLRVLREKFTRLIEVLVRHDIPITFLWYPRLVRDPDYLYNKLQFLLGAIDQTTFRSAFDALVRPDWIHQFNSEDQ